MGDVGKGLLRPTTFHLASVDFIIVKIEVVMMEDGDIGLKRTSTIPLVTAEK